MRGRLLTVDQMDEYIIDGKTILWCFEDDDKELQQFSPIDNKALEESYLNQTQETFPITHDSYISFSRNINRFIQHFEHYQRPVYRVVLWSYLDRSDPNNTRWLPISRRECVRLEQAFFEQRTDCAVLDYKAKVELSTPIEEDGEVFFVFRSKDPPYKSLIQRGALPDDDQCMFIIFPFFFL